MKLIRNIAVLLAGAILMLHNFLPHQHHSELSEEEHITQHETAENLYDFLQLIFHMDQGEAHLERYQTTDHTQLSFHFPQLEKTVVYLESTTSGHTPSFDRPASEGLFTRYLASQLRFRGPPHQG